MSASAASAQNATATETISYRFQAFGMYSAAVPGYQPNGYSSFNKIGATLGADVGIPPFHSIEPSLELRASLATGDEVRLRTLLPGLRLQYRIGRFKPYLNLLVGIGDVYLQKPTIPGYRLNNSIVYSPGGGVDYDITPRFAARADFQKQFWKIDDNPLIAFQPSWFSVGVVYRFTPYVKR